ncbi:hypothetical protein [Halodurantibacterium flavum]|uniref:Lipoprotein n=1 Tax=Halodurantibacterium flavum TaxID=1382802 RepID=A0ABW4SA32_9RHOB
MRFFLPLIALLTIAACETVNSTPLTPAEEELTALCAGGDGAACIALERINRPVPVTAAAPVANEVNQ